MGVVIENSWELLKIARPETYGIYRYARYFNDPQLLLTLSAAVAGKMVVKSRNPAMDSAKQGWMR